MALIKKLKDKTPEMGENCWMAETAVVIGDTIMGNECTVWYNAVVRGDVHEIRMGNRVNVQDGAVIHCTYQKAGTYIGNNVSIGHNALVHGCTIHDNVLIGMGSIVMDNCIVESNSIIAAGAVLLEGSHVKAGSIWAGVPAKKVKDADPKHIEGEINRIANNYVKYASWFQED